MSVINARKERSVMDTVIALSVITRKNATDIVSVSNVSQQPASVIAFVSSATKPSVMATVSRVSSVRNRVAMESASHVASAKILNVVESALASSAIMGVVADSVSA